MIRVDKKYRTRDGREVRIYAVDGGEEYCVHGAVLVDGIWEMVCWTKEGSAWTTTKDMPFDLIEVRPRIKREVWVNVYPISARPFTSAAYNSKVAADINSVAHRIACVKLTIDCDEGEGLTNE